jgi:multisubunit Na+/H+ antiporter MnhG subunit
MCEATDLPVHFGIDVVGMVFVFFLIGQSQLKCPNSLHLKHFPSFMRRVHSSTVIQSMSIMLRSFFLGEVNFFCTEGAPKVFVGLSSRFLKSC